MRILEEDEFNVSLNFVGNDLEPEEITRILGRKPTSFVRKGMKHTIGKRELGPATYGSWSLETESSTKEIEETLIQMFSQLNGDLTAWEHLTKKYKGDLFCGVYLAWFGHGFTMTPRLHRMLADRNLEITFDIYPEFDFEDAYGIAENKNANQTELDNA